MTNFTNVVGIHGVPRSGTSWLAQIFNSHQNVKLKFQPLFSYALKNEIDEYASEHDIYDFYNKMWLNNNDLFLNFKDPIIHKNYPNFIKDENPMNLVFKQVHHHYILNNLLIKDKNIRVILIIRNPLSVLSSWKKAPKEFNPEWDYYKEWKDAQLKNKDLKENYFGYNKWCEVTQLFLKLENEFPDRVYILNYSDLLSDTIKEVEEIFKFSKIGKPDIQTYEFIRKSKSINHSDPNSVYKTKTNDSSWKNNLPQEIIDEIKNDSLFILMNKKFKWLENEL